MQEEQTEHADAIEDSEEISMNGSMISIGSTQAPKAPETLEDTGIDTDILADLALRYAHTVPTFTTEKAAQHLCLPQILVGELLKKLRKDKLIENLGAAGPLDYRFTVTDAGRERAKRLMDVSGYAGAAPVALEDYTSFLQEQLSRFPRVTPQDVSTAIKDLVMTEDAVQVASFAGSSNRSLFIYGPAGNGKTTLAHLLHNACKGDLWIPYCIGVDSSIVRVFDPQFHEIVDIDVPAKEAHRVDRRWVRIRRPFIVSGGEMTLESMDLGYSPSLGFYEAPIHLKANGGTFLLDDLGFQQVEPQALLSRWIFPLENGVDYLSLQTGQKIEVPFSQKLLVSTNIDPEKVMSAAFLRRMGYRLYLGDAPAVDYVEIFRRYAARFDVAVPSRLLEWLLDRYKTEDRPLRGCEPRDLIERVRDICMFMDRDMELSEETVDLAWKAYFGTANLPPASR